MSSCGCREAGCPHVSFSDRAVAEGEYRARTARQKGLHQKFVVRRTDGTNRKGEKHHGCDYFVLELTHDTFAAAALLAYADACETEYPELAADLRESAASGRLAYRGRI